MANASTSVFNRIQTEDTDAKLHRLSIQQTRGLLHRLDPAVWTEAAIENLIGHAPKNNDGTIDLLAWLFEAPPLAQERQQSHSLGPEALECVAPDEYGARAVTATVECVAPDEHGAKAVAVDTRSAPERAGPSHECGVVEGDTMPMSERERYVASSQEPGAVEASIMTMPENTRHLDPSQEDVTIEGGKDPVPESEGHLGPSHESGAVEGGTGAIDSGIGAIEGGTGTMPECEGQLRDIVARDIIGDDADPVAEIDFAQILRSLPAGLQLPPYEGSSINFLHDYVSAHQMRLSRLAAQARILIHSRVMSFVEVFLGVKMIRGNECEKKLYQGMTPNDFILRLLFHRPSVFWQADDNWKLKDGTEGVGYFENIGMKTEREPLVIRDLLSYDEMQVSAFLSVSAPTPFFNNGDRGNCGRQDGKPFPLEGVYVGVVGARFEKPDYMEFAHMLVTPKQNTVSKGYGQTASGQHSHILRAWANFYGRPHLPTWQEALQAPESYLRLSANMLLDRDIYKTRLRMSIEPFLLDADARGHRAQRLAYVHVVGLGLGVWALDNTRQADLMLEVYRDLLVNHSLDNVSTIHFSWFPEDCNRDTVKHDRIRILFSRRDVADPIGSDELLVGMYAWDSNSYPGNEYWLGALEASGDPAAACCSAISVLQNAEVNPTLRDAASITVLPCAETASASSPKVRLQLKEPSQPRYLYVSENNVVLLMLPLVGGEEIGTDNTCQTVLEMQRFFGKRFNSEELKDSALHMLYGYLRALNCDLRLLSMCGAGSKGGIAHDVFGKKDSRKLQIQAYLQAFSELFNDHDFSLDSLQGSYPIFPRQVSDLIKRSTNLFCMLLSPCHTDDWLRLPEYRFRLRRDSDAAFGSQLRRCFQSKLKRDGPPADPLLAQIFSKGLRKEDRPTAAKFTQMQQNLVLYMTVFGEARPTFSYNTLQELTDILGVECDTMAELYQIYLSAESITPPESQSLFSGVNDKEELTMMAQMFIGVASLHLAAYAASRTSLADECEGAHARNRAQEICNACYELDPDSALLEWAETHSDVRLSGDIRELVKKRFRGFWTTVKNAPHMDEFLLHFSDKYTDESSLAVSHQGCICVPFSQLRKANHEKDEMVRQAANQEFARLRGQLASEGQNLRHENKSQVCSEPLEVEEDMLRRLAELGSPDEAAEMLLMLQEDGTPLYKRFMREGQEPMHHWGHIKMKIIGMLQDQAAIDAFSECLREYERSAKVWLRITTFFARSIYTEASATVGSALEQLAALSNDERPYKLQRALHLLHMEIELNDIIMSEYFDGYSIHVTQEDKERLLQIHSKRRQNFHLTPEMARLLYQLVERRYGRDSPSYQTMQGYNNADMHPVPDPRTLATRSRRGREPDMIMAPLKIFHACCLLDMLIPRWEFNHYSGYIVSASSAVIDQLESTVEWSRGLLSAEATGAPATRAVRRRR